MEQNELSNYLNQSVNQDPSQVQPQLKANNQSQLPQLDPRLQSQQNKLNSQGLQNNPSSLKMPSISQKFHMKRVSDQQEEFELYEGSSQRFKPVQSVNLVDKFNSDQKQQLQQNHFQSPDSQNQQQDTNRGLQQSQQQNKSPFNNNSLSYKLGQSLNQQLVKSNFHSNDSNVLQQKLADLEAELAALDSEYEQLQLDSEHLKEEQEDIKNKNKQLFEQITLMGGASGTGDDLISDSLNPNNNANLSVSTQINQPNMDPNSQHSQDNNIGEIHSLYQDLFLTDIKKEVESAQTELKQCKQEQNNVQREMAQLKKENQQLNATLKRYRKMLQEMTNSKKDELSGVIGGFMSPSDLQKMHMMSFESVGVGMGGHDAALALQQQQQQAGIKQPGGDTTKTGGRALKRSDSGTSSMTNLVSQATFIETAKIERLLAALMTIQQTDKVYDILMTGLRELKALINCQSCTMFIFSQELQKQMTGVEKTQNMNMQKFQMDGGQWIDALCENDREVSQPGFKKPEDIKYGLKTQQFLAHPIMFREEEIIVVVQCEARFNKKTNKYMGFQVADEQILKILCYYLQMRFERRIALREVKQKEQAVVDTLRLTSEICTQRHHEGLFRKMRENLPDFFGFESVGVLIYNFKTNWLFTDPDNVKDHRPPGQSSTPMNAVDSANLASIINQDSIDSFQQLSSTQQLNLKQHLGTDKTEDQKAQEAMQKIKEVHQKKFMNFPCNSGISGIVFQSGQIYVSNNAAKETKFIDEIDNQSTITDVKNFMIGPVYGERKDMPCGIIQFVNKTKGAQITASDESKFKAMQGLLGMCIDNTNEMSLTINVTLDVHDVMQKIQEIMKRDQQQEEEYEKSDHKLSNLGDNIKSIKETFNKLVEDRNKGKSNI